MTTITSAFSVLLAVALATGCKLSSSSTANPTTTDTPPAHGKPVEPTFLHSSPVEFDGAHDPSLVFLKDGLQLEVLYGNLTLQEVAQWQPGRKLTLAYSTLTGPILLDQDSQRHLPVIGGWRRHPLDSHIDELMKVAVKGPNVPMINTAHDAAGLWKAEMERLAGELEHRLRGKRRAAFIKSQRAWLEFKAAEIAFLWAMDDEVSGNHSSFVSAQHIMTINRNRALLLYGHFYWVTE